MIEPRREPGLAQEAPCDDAAATHLRAQHLDDRLSPKQWLLAAIHGSEAPFGESSAKREASHGSPGQIPPARAGPNAPDPAPVDEPPGRAGEAAPGTGRWSHARGGSPHTMPSSISL